MATRSNDQPPEDFWRLVEARAANPLTDAKRAAIAAGEPLPVEVGDFIRWDVSFRVSGWVMGDGEMAVGKSRLPCWVIWNPLAQERQEVPKDAARLMGWG